MRKIFTLIFILPFIWCTAYSQPDTYYTRNATLTMYGQMGDDIIKLQSRKLNVTLDYESACIIIRFPVSSLVSEVDSLNALFKMTRGEVVFDGKLGMDYVMIDNHPPMKFNFEGTLMANNQLANVRGEGELNHIGDRAGYSSMMGLCMMLNLNDLGVESPWPSLSNEFEAIVTQALLTRDKN